MQNLIRVCLFSILFATGYTAHSQSWTRITTLPATWFQSIEVIGTTLYAGATDTMFYSKDFGARWISRVFPNSCGYVNAFIELDGRLYVGTSKGVFMTSDEGVSWTSSNISFPVNQFVEWKGELYAATGAGGGVFACSQSGNNWSAFNDGLTLNSFTNFIRIIRVGTSMMAFTDISGVVAKFDESLQKWTTTNLSISVSSGTYVLDIAKDGNSIYAQITDEKAAVIYRSEDDGDTWTPDGLGLRHGGTSGAMWRGYYKTYLFWNMSGVASYTQERMNSSAPSTNWGSNDDYFLNGTVSAAREFDRRLFIAAASGVWTKDNGSPAVSVKGFQQESEVALFPNPALNGMAQIRAQGLTDVKITDVLGQVIFEKSSIKDGQLMIHLNTPGVYYVNALVNGQRISRSLEVL